MKACRWAQSYGVRTLRIANRDVFDDAEGAVKCILEMHGRKVCAKVTIYNGSSDENREPSAMRGNQWTLSNATTITLSGK